MQCLSFLTCDYCDLGRGTNDLECATRLRTVWHNADASGTLKPGYGVSVQYIPFYVWNKQYYGARIKLMNGCFSLSCVTSYST